MDNSHKCKEWSDAIVDMDIIRTKDKTAIYYYGPALTKIEFMEKAKVWVAHCDEYATIINYCPFCGVKL